MQRCPGPTWPSRPASETCPRIGTLPLTGRIFRAGSAQEVRIAAGNSTIHSDGKGKARRR